MLYLYYFSLGVALSFLGQLPPGTMSFTATQIAVQENFHNAWKYSVGVALIEMIYLRTVLSGMQWVVAHPVIFNIFNWFTVIFFLVFGVISFIMARKQHQEDKALLLNNRISRFLLGISMSMFNAAQIPFWFIWSTYFIDIGWLKAGNGNFNLFTVGSGLGTIGGLMVYIYGGNWLVSKIKTSNRTLNKIMAGIFILAGIIQLYRILGT